MFRNKDRVLVNTGLRGTGKMNQDWNKNKIEKNKDKKKNKGGKKQGQVTKAYENEDN